MGRFALFQKGFRPFFLLAAVFAAVIVPLWMVVLSGKLSFGSYLGPIAWHAHEMVFGFSAAVIAGFLLTAASNWTQRTTATGLHLAALCALWVAGRTALFSAAWLPGAAVMTLNLVFLPALAITLARPLLAASNKRNYAFIGLLAALWLAQLGVHLGAIGVAPTWQQRGSIVGVDIVILVILLVGGRVIPFFTKNATQAPAIESAPRLDRASLGGMSLLTLFDVFAVDGALAALICGLTALFALLRARRWGAQYTRGEPLLWVLHVGYLFLPIGLASRSASFLGVLPSSAALHALTAGCIGTLTIGMMSRVALGHTGRPLQAGRWLGAAFGLVVLAALLRIGSAWVPEGLVLSALHLASTSWALAFLIYVIRLGGVLIGPRPDGRPG